ncbi:MAG: putative acylesterase/phospholipase RssA [Neolewinella sp.]|jgi:predicted acylesterase/phospholipase RssA
MLPIPFSNIAISLSGGGYRATTFHLGALSLLNEVKTPGGESLLSRVSILSTISGGTLTGVMYTLKVVEGYGYQECFDKLYQLLEEDKLVERALGKLNAPGKWTNKHKSRDVINAFSEVYDEYFYERATFAELYENPTGNLNDIIFGASEFTTGIQFRFQRGHEDEMFGNGNLDLPREAAAEIRLADAAASSSCFPGGFEPMIMPKDFGNGPDSRVNQAWNNLEHEPVTAIMDGGVLDNQGIEGVKLAERRHKKNDVPFIGTYIISDVTGETMDPLVVPELEHSRFRDFFTFRSVNVIALLLLAVAVTFLILSDATTLEIVLVSALSTVITLWYALYTFTRKTLLNEVRNTFTGGHLPGILNNFRVLTRTPLYILFYLVKFRGLSVMKMVMDIFLRRIRRLQLDALFASPDWNGRIKTNNIYTLKGKHLNEVGSKIQRVVENANNMPTTLWFSEEEKENHMLDDLIASGQFSLCFNLLKYCREIKEKTYDGKNIWEGLEPAQRAEVEAIEQTLEEYWVAFKKEPYWLLNKDKVGVVA